MYNKRYSIQPTITKPIITHYNAAKPEIFNSSASPPKPSKNQPQTLNTAKGMSLHERLSPNASNTLHH